MVTDTLLPDALVRLETALREILGGDFEEEVRAQTETEPWYQPSIPVCELFRLWVRSRVLDGKDPSWVFSWLRMADRRRLFQNLALPSDKIARSSPTEHAELVLDAVGLPVKRTRGRKHLIGGWREVSALIETGEDEKAATLGRQRAERFLRKILYFYCAAGYGNLFATMIKNPGNLRVPRAFEKATETEYAELFINDDISDLGFLALALRKFAVRIEEASILGLSGAPLQIFSQSEYEHFSSLGTALQPYTHDKPSKHDVRRGQFASAAQSVVGIVESMAARNVVPDDAFVLETCLSLVGGVFRGVTDDGTQVHFMSQKAPPLGKRVLYLSSASCKYATCIWAPNPWPI